MSQITIQAGEKELNFNVETDDFNQYINEQMPDDKVKPAFNFLSRTFSGDRKNFDAVALIDGKPNGIVIMQMTGVIAEEFGGDVSITIKKQKESPAV